MTSRFRHCIPGILRISYESGRETLGRGGSRELQPYADEGY